MSGDVLDWDEFGKITRQFLAPPPVDHDGPLRCADFFCGIGGFHLAAQNLGLEVVYACDIDDEARRAYTANFKFRPEGDIAKARVQDMPPHDILMAGFPCQPFSIIGRRQGFKDQRGVLFFELMRVLRVHRPQGVILENVRQLETAQGGAVLARIKSELEGLAYTVDHRVLNALDFGLPQKRERAIVVATMPDVPFPWPTGNQPMTPLSEILEANPDRRHYVSDTIRNKRYSAHCATEYPSIWHENKAGNISSHPWSCALRASASHNYLLVDGERRLTSREMLRLQGFPDSYRIVCNDSQTRKQAGNAVPVPMVQAVLAGMVEIVGRAKAARRLATA